MEQSRLIKYISALDSREQDRFRQFVHSPYFNQHEKTTELLEIILAAQGKSAKHLERSSVFRKLFPREAYDEQKLHNHMSYLMKLYHRFLAVEYMEGTPFLQELFTMEQAYAKFQFDLMNNRGQQLNKKLQSTSHRDADFHYVSHRLHHLSGYHRAMFIDRSQSKSLQQMLDHFDYYYLAVKLKDCCHLTANMILMNTHYAFPLLEPMLDHIKENWKVYRQEPSIELYYNILMSLREEHDPQYYHELKKIMAERIDSLSPEEGNDLYQFSNNYCVRQINAGRSEYQRELFQLYKQGLQTGLLYTNDVLDEWAYKNITTLGCRLKEFAWTENFIQQYKSKLPEQRQENAYRYNLAYLYYTKQMYEETLSTLLHVQFTDVKYHLNTNFLLLRTYYAMRDTEALLSLLETFRIYVIRNRKMTTELKRGYTNFLRFAKRLVLLKHQSTTYSKKSLQEKLEKLTKKIESTDNVINRYWLLEECVGTPEEAAV